MENYRIEGIKPYLLGSIAEAVNHARQSGRDVVDLSQAIPDLLPPTSGVDKLVESILRPQNHRYSSSSGINKLREAIKSRYASRYGVSLHSANDITSTMGTKEGLAHLLLAITHPGDQALIPTPAYPVHSAALAIAGVTQIGVPLPDGADNFLVDSESFIASLKHAYKAAWPAPKVLILSFPHNPTTKIVNNEFWERVVEFAKTNELKVIHDFAYADICFEGYNAPSLLSVPGAQDVGVELFSLSKAYGIAGWRVGFCVGNSQLVQALKKIKSYIDFGIFQPIQIAAIKVLEDAENILAENLAIYQSRRDVLVSGLNEIGWDVSAPKATVFLWAKIPDKYQKYDSVQFSYKLLDEANVAVCPGGGFDQEANRYVRFALVDSEARLRQAVKNIGKMR